MDKDELECKQAMYNAEYAMPMWEKKSNVCHMGLVTNTRRTAVPAAEMVALTLSRSGGAQYARR